MIDIEEHLGLVKYIAKQRFGEFDDDDLQNGYIGLIAAARKYNETQKCKFSPYAAQSIYWGIVNGRKKSDTWEKRHKLRLETVIAYDDKPIELGEAITDDFNLEKYVENECLSEQVLHLIKQLPTVQRRNITLHFLYGMDYIDIAEQYGTTRQAVHFSAQLGLKKLRGMLENG